MDASPAGPPSRWQAVPAVGTSGTWRHAGEAQPFGIAGQTRDAANCLTPDVLQCLHRVFSMAGSSQTETPSQLGTSEQELRRAALLRRNIELKKLLGICLSTLSSMNHKENLSQTSSAQFTFQVRFALLLQRLNMKQRADIEQDEAAYLHAERSPQSSGEDVSAGSSNFVAQMSNESQPSSSHLHYVPVPVPATHQVPLPSFDRWKQIDRLIEAVGYSPPNHHSHVHMPGPAVDACIPLPRFVDVLETRWTKIQRNVLRNDWALASAQGCSFVGSVQLSL